MRFNPVETGNRIRILRENKHLSQSAFAELLDVSRDYITRIELGYRNPSIEVLMGISETCNVSVDFLLYGRCDEDVRKQKLRLIIDEMIKLEHLI